LPAPTASFQRSALDRLEQKARALAGTDEAKFIALLRAGMARLSVEVEKSERGIGGESADAVIASLNSAITVTDGDRDVELQSFIKRTVLESRSFGIRMVGATQVPAGARLETVAILQGAERTGCSGVVIAPGAVLTAAHCVCEFDLTRSPRQIVFGHDIKSPDAVSYTVPDKTRIYPAISANSPSIYCADYIRFAVAGHGRVCHRDIALVQFDPAAAPAELKLPRFASKSEVDVAFDRVRSPSHGRLLPIDVIGFGVEQVHLDSGTYRYGNDGRKRYGRFGFYFGCPGEPPFDCAVANNAYCMGQTEIVIQDLYKVTDSCAGDSGGPAFLNTDGGESRLVGLVSRATRKDGNCGPGGVYSATYTSDIIDWLGKNNVSIPP
jgi:hypothetical protein